MEEWFAQAQVRSELIIDTVALLIELVALGVIAVATARSAYRLISPRWRARPTWYGDIRIELGRAIILALEFLIGADILRSAMRPSWTTLGQLAVIVAIRTWLDFFMERELREIRSDEQLEEGKGREHDR